MARYSRSGSIAWRSTHGRAGMGTSGGLNLTTGKISNHWKDGQVELGTMTAAARPYHHGNLRPALLAAAVEAIEEASPATVSLREVARRAGVTHAAAAYHFGDKAGLLTAVAAGGYRLLGD